MQRACWRTRTPSDGSRRFSVGDPAELVASLPQQVLYRRFIPRFDAYLVVGQRAREYLQAYGAPRERMFDAPHFVDNDFFAQRADAARPSRAEIRRRWGLGKDSFVCLFAGKFIPKKRPLDFVRALARSAHRALGIEGLMVGDGPLRPEIERAISQEQSPVRLCGFLNKSAIAEAYAAADVLLLSSDGGETWGLVVNEAMATGLPAVVSDQVGCAPDLVREGETGMTYPCGDVDRLAEIIVEAANERTRWQQLGVGARRHVANYSVEAAVRGTCMALSRLHEIRHEYARLAR